MRSLALLLLLSAPLSADPAKPAPVPPAAPAEADDNPFGPAVQKALPSVVKIYGIGAGARISPFGTGVIVSPDGHILTIYSAILAEDLARGIQPKVTLADGRVLPARMILKSREVESAVLKIDAKDLPYLKPGDSDSVKPGHWLMIIGNAFNLAAGDEAPSVNLGVLSAVVDKLDASARVGAGQYNYKGKAFITDANNNPGSYGGPIISATGEWVGLTGRIVAGNATNTQINYGLPINELKDFLAAALAKRQPAPDEDYVRPSKGPAKAVVAGYHGIHLFDQGGQLPPPFVDRVDRKSPAKAAGLQGDDLIQYVNGKLVQTCAQFESAMAALPAGAEVKLNILRGREAKTPMEIVFKLEEPKK